MDENNGLSQRVRKLKEKASHEFRKFMAIFLYLWVVFALLSIHESIIRAQHGLDYRAHSFAVINAFVLAKVLLVGDHFRLGTRFKDRPLVYSVLYKSFVFSALLVGFHIVERMFVGAVSGKTFAQSFSAIGGGSLRVILSMGALSFVMLIPFFAFRELGRVIGDEELRALFYGRRTKAGVGTPRSRAHGTEEGKVLAK
jgi:hypothetical protein